MNRLGEIGTGAMLERQYFELQAGESKAVQFIREQGSRVRGKVTLPEETKLMGIIISIQSEKAEKGPYDVYEYPTTYASQTAAADGTFLTERIAPGEYLLVATAHTPLTDEQRFLTGIIGPSFQAQVTIEVSDDGELLVPDLVLKPIRGE